jgi:hypothetical protein
LPAKSRAKAEDKSKLEPNHIESFEIDCIPSSWIEGVGKHRVKGTNLA